MKTEGNGVQGRTADQLRQTTLTPELEVPRVNQEDLRATAHALFNAKRIVFVTGAGISVSAGIPDFRSKDGLYALAKNRHSSDLVKGQDLFDAGVFRSERTTRAFYSFIAGLRKSCLNAQPTRTHLFLRRMETSGNLLRCYTQNIDGLEHRTGMDQCPLSQDMQCACPSPPSSIAAESADCERARFAPQPCKGNTACVGDQYRIAHRKVVQLHGSLSQVRCVVCAQIYQFTDQHERRFALGEAPACPGCTEDAQLRSAQGKRSRATGILRPDVVLYNETHPLGDFVAELLIKDIKRRPDMLVVMGTSLKVHGIKRLVKDLAAAVHSLRLPDEECLDDSSSLGSSPISSDVDQTEQSLRRKAIRRKRPAMVVLINKTSLGSEWEGVVDHCFIADADTIIQRWETELDQLQRAANGRRAKREAAKMKQHVRIQGLPEERGQTRLSFPMVKNPPTIRYDMHLLLELLTSRCIRSIKNEKN